MTTESIALDLTACEREPIRVPGGIQPHGMMLVADAGSLVVLQASANAEVALGIPAEVLPGRPLAEVLDAAQHAAVVRAIARARETNGTPTKVGSWRLPGGQSVDCIVHSFDATAIVEFEFIEPIAEPDAGDLPDQILDFASALEGASDFQSLCRLAARQVRRLIGFDRVLVYQFDPSWDGIVVGEDRNETLPSYLDLRFPASDIPAQARDLYRTTRSRLIPDAEYAAVPLVPPLDPRTRRPLDMTFSTLRSVSPVHLEYMKNMGTAASTSFSVLRGGQLWGLIACHNATPRRVRFNVRRACELVAQTFSLQVAAHEARAAVETRVKLDDVRARGLRVAMASAGGRGGASYAETLATRPDDLIACVDAGGVAIVTEQTMRLIGQTPGEADVRALADWIDARHADAVHADDVYVTNLLDAELAGAIQYSDVASGVLSISISTLHRGHIVWFRPEVTRAVTWAGDPRKAATAGPYEAKLHPRQSFEAWKDTVRGSARPWQAAEVESARELRNDIIAIVLRRAEELAALSEELERSNKELEAFSYSVSHDLRAPFRHIVGYSELVNELEASRLSDRGRRYVTTVIDAARTAGKLIDNLLAFSQMGRSGLNCIAIDMNRLVAEVKVEVAAAEGAGRKIEWKIDALPATFGDPNMLRLAVRNLLSNAVKYTRGKSVAEISVSGVDDGATCVYRVADNGAGFDMAYVDKLFGVFQRLHRVEEFEGTGIGLANVRRIVGRHGGRTWAEAVVGRGATFFFSVPHGKPKGS